MDLMTDLDAGLDALWATGWQPADVVRFVGRELGQPEETVVSFGIRVGAAAYERLGRHVAPAWMAQVDALGPVVHPADANVATLFPDGAESAARAIRTALARLRRLPTLPCLHPPPAAWHAGMADVGEVRASVDDAVLGRVRGLLAKAERTTFEAEAAAFMAKAQEMMAKHRIDRAMIADSHEDGRLRDHAGGRRVGVDNPYPRGKYALLAGVAHANRCEAIWSPGLGFATIVGFPTDVAVVEELFTSLLLQATAAMQREGSKQDAYGRNRTRAFRHAFLLAYASRIGERLQEAADEVEEAADAAAGGALLPALVARDEAVQEFTAELFPKIQRAPTTVSDREGLYAGRMHADRADLSAGAHLPH